jgi:restriction endonuclease S subunit
MSCWFIYTPHHLYSILYIKVTIRGTLPKKGLYFYKLAAEIANGQGLIEGDRDQTGEYAVFGSGGQVGKHNDALMTEPYVVIGRKGSAGKVTFASEGGWVTDTAYYAFPRNPKELECKYLFYATKSLDFTDDVITTAIPGINRTAIYAHKIPLPPLPNSATSSPTSMNFRQRWTRSGASRQRPAPNWMR